MIIAFYFVRSLGEPNPGGIQFIALITSKYYGGNVVDVETMVQIRLIEEGHEFGDEEGN